MKAYATIPDSADRRLDSLHPLLLKAGAAVAALGLLLALAGIVIEGGNAVRLAHGYLVAYLFTVSLLLGSLLYVLFQHLTGAGWGTSIRRVPEILSGLLPLWCLLGLPILFFLPFLYPWADAASAGGEATGFRAAVMSPLAFAVRMIVYFACWAFLGFHYLRRSVRQDETGDPSVTLSLQRLSPAATIIWAITVTMFSFDVFMSLDAIWYSTLFGVYFFSGAMVGALALIILLVRFLEKGGALRDGVVTLHHYHDLGKYLFAFNLFWAYIAFSQYMLIWYANIPEETAWYALRLSGGWGWIGWVLLFGHFVIPFLGLMSRHVKRRPGLLAFWAGWLLVMHLIDTWWLVIPPLSPGQLSLSLIDAGFVVLLSGLLPAAFAHVARNISLVATGDPRLPEGLAHAGH